MAVVALAHEIEAEPEAVHVQLFGTSQGETAACRMGRVVDVERLAAAVARGHTLDLKDRTSGITAERLSPSRVNSIGLNSTPRKSETKFSRIKVGGPPACPPTIAASAWRCSSSARSSTTPAKIQFPSAMTLPERITSANFSPSRPVLP